MRENTGAPITQRMLGHETLRDRIRTCTNLAGSGNSLAKSTGIPRRTLENYLSGRSEPKWMALAAIAKTVNVNGHWLLTGEGPMLLEELYQPSNGKQNEELLRSVIEAVEGVQERLGLKIEPPTKKADLILAIYEMYHNTGIQPDPAKMARLIKATV